MKVKLLDLQVAEGPILLDRTKNKPSDYYKITSPTKDKTIYELSTPQQPVPQSNSIIQVELQFTSNIRLCLLHNEALPKLSELYSPLV